MDCQHNYRIAHLSDLHFSKDNIEAWSYAKDILARHKPKLVVVTGDIVNSPSLFQLALVRREFQCLEDQLECKVITVPGNHDVGIFGNLAISPWRSKYWIIFSGQHDKKFLDEINSLSEFFKKSFIVRLLYRAKWFFKFSFLRLTWKLTAPSKSENRLLDLESTGWRALIASFDSNSKLWLATGRVEHGEIASLEREINSLTAQDKSGWLAPRIALTHHHAIAIPYSSTKESLTSFEPFLAMRNSGTLLYELGKLEFDLLLHGHKHYSNYVRVSYAAPGFGASEMAVIAAGSATVDQQSAGGNSLNLIDLMPNGLINYTPFFFGNGKTVSSSSSDGLCETRSLLTLDQLKERSYRKAVKHMECSCDVLKRSVSIDVNGGADFKIRVEGYKAFGSRITRQVNLRIGVSSGGIIPNGVHLDSESLRDGHNLDNLNSGFPTKHLKATINLKVDTSGAFGNSANFGIQCRATNCFAITDWEASLISGNNNYEWSAIVIRQPAKQAVMVVEIPDSIRNTEEDVLVICQRPINYPILKFDSSGEVVAPTSESEWVNDQDFTNLEKGNIRKSLVNEKAEQGKEVGVTRFELSVDRPMVGFRYLICWPVRKSEPACPVKTKGQTFELRKTLAQAQNSNCSSRLSEVRETMQVALDDYREKVLLPMFRAPFAQNELFVMTLLVYNEATKSLDVLLESGPNDLLSGRCTTIPVNEGVVGSVFKTRKVGIYILPELVNGVHDGLYVYHEEEKSHLSLGQVFSVLVALPLYLGDYGPQEKTDRESGSNVPPEGMIGVLTVGSNARDSGLTRFTTDGFNDEEATALLALPELFVKGMVDALDQLSKPVLEQKVTVDDNLTVNW